MPTWLWWCERLVWDHLRAQPHEKGLDGDDADPVDSGPTPEEEALGAERRRALQTCRERLAERDRELLDLRYALGLRYRAIAIRMSMTVSNVGVVLSRAEERIRRCLRERYPDLLGARRRASRQSCKIAGAGIVFSIEVHRMPEPHLTLEQIVALRDGELRDWAVVCHLRACLECQARLREAHMLQVLLSGRSPNPRRTRNRRSWQRTSKKPCRGEIPASWWHTSPPAPGASPIWRPFGPNCNQQPRRRTPRPTGWLRRPRAVSNHLSPPWTLGKVVVEWLRRLGLALEYYPPTAEAGPRTLPMINMMDSLSDEPAGMVMMDFCFEDTLCRAELSEDPPDHTIPPEPVEQEAGPQVEVTVGDLGGRLAARGRSRDSVKLTIVITRQQDSTPVPGARLALETDQETLRPTMTDAAGTAEFPLPPGPTTLTFLSPVHAELKILF